MSGTRASRRHFIGATGLALSAPLAGVGAKALQGSGDVETIRALLHDHATSLGATPGAFGARDRITLAADGRSATATLPCIAATEDAIGPDCPLVDMARQQGGGVLRGREPGHIEFSLLKRDGLWTIERAAFQTMS